MRFASLPTAWTSPVWVSIATTDGSLATIPELRTYTSVLAVPRSIAMSRAPIPKAITREGRRWVGSAGPFRRVVVVLVVGERRRELDRLAGRDGRLVYRAGRRGLVQRAQIGVVLELEGDRPEVVDQAARLRRRHVGERRRGVGQRRLGRRLGGRRRRGDGAQRRRGRLVVVGRVVIPHRRGGQGGGVALSRLDRRRRVAIGRGVG